MSKIPHSWLAVTVMMFQVMAVDAATEKFLLASDGQPKAKIIIPAKPCPATKQAAKILATYLQRITGAKFAIASGDGKSGIAVGMAKEFPALSADPALKIRERFAPTDLATKQSYILRSHKNGVQIIAASEIGVLYGTWDFLYRLGYRQFFPTQDWEIIPRNSQPVIAVDDFEKPDFIARRIAGSVTQDWCERNRTSFDYSWKTKPRPYIPLCWQKTLIQNQHNWGSIIDHSQKEFDAHPEYYGLVEVEQKEAVPAAPKIGEDKKDPDQELEEELANNQKDSDKEKKVKMVKRRLSTKLCVSNPGVRRAAIRYVIDYFKQHPDAPSVSLEPTDGGGWCLCAKCAKIGSPSDRVALLANTVAKALEQDFPDKYIGVLAYYTHSDPPKCKLHPRVCVSLATALSGKKSMQERLREWSKVCHNLGVYEYLSVGEWHLGLPTKSLISNIPRLTELIPFYYHHGVRFFTGQAAGGAWGGHGFGYYYLSRLLWDVDEAQRVDEIRNDFLRKAFGPAAEIMREYYEVIDASHAKPGSAEFFLGQTQKMYAVLRKAKKAADTPAIQKRLNDLVLYTRYAELYALYARAKRNKDREQWQIFCRLRRFVERIKDRGMIEWINYALNANKVELRPEPEKKPGDLGLEDRKTVAFVDRPISEKYIMKILNGKANDWPKPDDKKILKSNSDKLLDELNQLGGDDDDD